MTIANLNSNLNLYMTNFLKPDLERIQTDLTEMVQSKESLRVSSPREIQDEYIPHTKQKVEVTLEERLSQVISHEEIKNLLSLLVKGPRFSLDHGQLVDIKV